MVYSGFTRIVLIKYPSFCMHVVGLLISYFQKASFEKLFLSEVFRRVFPIRSPEAASKFRVSYKSTKSYYCEIFSSREFTKYFRGSLSKKYDFFQSFSYGGVGILGKLTFKLRLKTAF